MTDESTPAAGMDRRELLKRGALVGGAGALMWAAPSVTKFANPAFGQTEGTPEGEGKDFSYIALRYRCGDDPTVYSIKFDLDENKCTTGDFRTPRGQNTDCEFETGASRPEDCTNGTFTLTSTNGFKTVRIDLNGPHGDCILDGVGVGKCGSPASVPEPCVFVDADGAKSITFELCGV